MTLNQQELRHATYWGPFIRTMEEIADIEFWGNSGVFSANDRRRMLDVEFISELTIAYLNGPQNKKKTLEEFYQQYEVAFDQAEEVNGMFRKVLGEIDQLLPNITKSRWRKKSDFYTLFLTLAKWSDQLPLPSDLRVKVASSVSRFAEDVDLLIADGIGNNTSESVRKYLKHVERAASDLGSRKGREQVLETLIRAELDDPKR